MTTEAATADDDAIDLVTASALLDGSVLIIGGARPVHQHLASVERFDPATNTFSSWRPFALQSR